MAHSKQACRAWSRLLYRAWARHPMLFDRQEAFFPRIWELDLHLPCAMYASNASNCQSGFESFFPSSLMPPFRA